jgi:hypothetical protein
MRYMAGAMGNGGNSMSEEFRWEVLSAGEMRRKYGLFAENRPVIRLDRERVPERLRHLIPLAEKFGIADDLVRQDCVAKTTEAELLELRRVLKENDRLLDGWLIDPNTDRLSKEYIVFTAMRMAADGT